MSEQTNTTDAMEKHLRLVSNLKARAEHPNTPQAERDICMERIERLMARHSITEAMLDARNAARGSNPINYDIDITSHLYAGEKSILLNEIAQIFNCRVLKLSDFDLYSGRRSYRGRLRVFGFPKDSDMVWELFEMLLTQVDLQVFGVQGGSRARRSFILGFTDSVARRIRKTYAEEIAAMEAETGETGTALILAGRAATVEAYMSEKEDWKKSRKRNIKVDVGAYFAGQDAGEDADINLAKVASTGDNFAINA